jgi:molybdopterin-containing oxidoreductase family membrane subunit
MIVLCLVIPFPILAFRRTRTVAGCVVASIAINIGMWLERFTIVVPSLSMPRLPYASWIYLPSWVEWSVTAASFAMLALLYLVFLKLFPIVSVWEVDEGGEAAPSPVPDRPSEVAPSRGARYARGMLR